MTLTQPEMVYLGSSGLELADTADDLRGMVVVDPSGLRVGEVEDVVIDGHERHVRLLSVVSGGILGLPATRVLVPVEAVARVGDRVRVDRTHADVRHLPAPGVGSESEAGAHRQRDAGRSPFAEAYDSYGVVPFWAASGAATHPVRWQLR